jgi:hypothetical protein
MDVFKRNEEGEFIMGDKIRLKWPSKERNPDINHNAFLACVEEGKVITGENCGFYPRKPKKTGDKSDDKLDEKVDKQTYELCKVSTTKIALSRVHTKMVGMKNGVFAPFIYGKNSNDYKN